MSETNVRRYKNAWRRKIYSPLGTESHRVKDIKSADCLFTEKISPHALYDSATHHTPLRETTLGKYCRMNLCLKSFNDHLDIE